LTQYRARFDAYVTFGNGGDLSTRGFRVDVPAADTSRDEVTALFLAAVNLLMVESVELSNVEILAGEHQGTPGGPSDPRTTAGS
jgi:arylformamidase